METLTTTAQIAATADAFDALVEVLTAAAATLPPAAGPLDQLLADAAKLHVLLAFPPEVIRHRPAELLLEARAELGRQLQEAQRKVGEQARLDAFQARTEALNRWHARQLEKRVEAARAEKAEKERLLAEQKAQQEKAWEELNRQQMERWAADRAFQAAHADDPPAEFAN